MSPFDFVNSINSTKTDLMVDDQTEKQYSAWIVNKSLSYFQDTVLIANEMNGNAFLDNRLQYDFLRSIVRPRKRFSKFMKPDDHKKLSCVVEYYGVSKPKAKEYLKLLTDSQLQHIVDSIEKRGKYK